MPNWCSNKATIVASSETDLLQLLRLAKRGYKPEEDGEYPERGLNVFMMDSVLPTPQHLLDAKGMTDEVGFQQAIEGNKEYEYNNWYNWRLAHWGTKWDIAEVEMGEITHRSKDKYSVSLWYNTAWSPNVAFWEYVCELGPFEVELKYFEEGMGFVGETLITKDGIEENHQQITTEMLVSVGAYLDDDGEIDWDESDVNMWDLFPLEREKVK